MGRSSNRSWIAWTKLGLRPSEDRRGRVREPSQGSRLIVRFDHAALAGLALGLALYVLPFWREGRLRPAFWITLVSTLLHVYTSHKRAAKPGAEGGEGSA